jgi:hypothetical protein
MYDPECETLAEHFLQDDDYTKYTKAKHEARVRSLAQAIQDAVEEWTSEREDD